MVVKNRDEIKNIAGQVLTDNSKNFHWLNKKLDLDRRMNELERPVLKNQMKKFLKKENQCQNAACEQKTTSEKSKFGSNKILGLE